MYMYYILIACEFLNVPILLHARRALMMKLFSGSSFPPKTLKKNTQPNVIHLQYDQVKQNLQIILIQIFRLIFITIKQIE